ncbi:hypothetical protein P4V41_07670 [Fictibacillus nanhaiensis]|uniref:hypothetical protein n=1 Tax=Fictibacillus nanhaiensis TaxID=742169 RepID=UPI002E1B2FF2|nr:hypothetical protein [Fictibacillus nanhaiensis]
MGYIRHNSIIVTGGGYPEADEKFYQAHKKARELFDSLVSEIIEGLTNGYKSFFVAPDGSKEGWELSNHYDIKRQELYSFIDLQQYGDGSNPTQFVDIGFDECNEVEVDRKKRNLRK